MDTAKRGSAREHTAAELRAQLARRRISAAEFARRVGWKQSYMARRYDGRTAMDVEDLEVIANELGITIEQLIGGGGKRPQDMAQYPPLTARGPNAANRPRPGRPKNRADTTAPAPHLRRPGRIHSTATAD